MGGSTGMADTEGRRQLVTIITGTWQRNGLLLEAIRNVRRQTHPEIEHLVVSDGLDPRLPDLLMGLPPSHIPLRYLPLGRNTTGFFPNSHAIGPLIAGCFVASGDFIGYLPDDDRMEPTYIAKLVRKLEETGSGFAYSKARHQAGQHQTIIGTPDVRYGQVANFLHRAELLKVSMWRLGDGVANDWALIQRWVQAGVPHAFVNEILFTHHADH
jgi:hypothetical protein